MKALMRLRFCCLLAFGTVLITVVTARSEASHNSRSVPAGLGPSDWANIRQQVYLKASNTAPPPPGQMAGDNFGSSVAMSGNTLVVGAMFEDSGSAGVNGEQSNDSITNSGAAYVFVRDGTNWTQQAYLKASNPGPNYQFGFSVAISGDTIVVGSHREDSSGAGVNGDQNNDGARDAGAAYVFVREGTNWAQQAYFKASNPEAFDLFGRSVAISGDTVAVSAPQEDSDATGANGDQGNNDALESGAVYVFVRDATNWTQQAYLKASNTGADDRFGFEVALDTDTLIVGAWQEDSSATGVNGDQRDNNAPESGAAYVFVRAGTNWSQEAYLKASNSEVDDHFGFDVSISRDTVVVGASGEDSSATGVNGDQTDNLVATSGAAYVFVRSGTNWSQQGYLKASNTEAFDQFGCSVGVAGDAIIIGALAEDSDAIGVNGDQSNNNIDRSGAAYLFARSGTTWSQQAYLKASNTGANDEFGGAVGLAGDTVVVTAVREASSATGINGDQNDDTAVGSGAVYVFAVPGRPELRVPQDYPTIQAAVDAALPGDTIRIAAGDYYEQALIADKGTLTLVGEPGAVIHATTSMRRTLEPFGSTTYPIVAVVRSEVTISGITFEGERLGNTYPNELFGIIFRACGGRVENCTMRGFRGVTSTDARAINTINLVSFGTEVVDITIRNNTFSDNYRSVVFFDDANYPSRLRTRFTIEDNSFTGLGPDSTQAHLGISLLTGSGGDCRGNLFTGYSYRGSGTGFSAGIRAQDGLFSPTRGFVPVQPVRYEGNRFLTNDHGLVIANANNSQVVSNIFEGTTGGVVRWGSLALSGTNVLVEGNQFSDMPIGIELFGGEMEGGTLRGVATNPRLLNNRFCAVAEPVRAQPLANGIDEQGTEVCSNPPPPRVLNVPAEYSTIQGAVNAAKSGDTIRIAAGTYPEQIVIANKGELTLLGEPGAVVEASGSMTETLRVYNWRWFPVLGIYRSHVTVRGLNFDGGGLGNLYRNLIGIYFLGSSGELTNCAIRGFRASTLSASTASGLYTDNSVVVGSPVVNINVLNCTFEENELSIHLRGDPVNYPGLLRTTFMVERNIITGWGPAALALDGIAIRNGAGGEVRWNTIRDHAYTGSGDPFSSGIAAHDGRASVRGYFVPLFPVRYEGNTFLNNDEHLVIVGGNGSEIVNNTFAGGGPEPSRWGGLVVSGTNVTIANNNFADLSVGTVLFGDHHFFSGWPRIMPAADVRFVDNWFCSVALTMDAHAGVTGLMDRGTQQCETRALQPTFKSVGDDNGTLEMTLRAWHAQTVVVETSTNLVDWLPLHTNAIALPTLRFVDATLSSSPRRFYRAVSRE